jgi:hypothetical protein
MIWSTRFSKRVSEESCAELRFESGHGFVLFRTSLSEIAVGANAEPPTRAGNLLVKAVAMKAVVIVPAGGVTPDPADVTETVGGETMRRHPQAMRGLEQGPEIRRLRQEQIRRRALLTVRLLQPL